MEEIKRHCMGVHEKHSVGVDKNTVSQYSTAYESGLEHDKAGWLVSRMMELPAEGRRELMEVPGQPPSPEFKRISAIIDHVISTLERKQAPAQFRQAKKRGLYGVVTRYMRIYIDGPRDEKTSSVPDRTWLTGKLEKYSGLIEVPGQVPHNGFKEVADSQRRMMNRPEQDVADRELDDSELKGLTSGQTLTLFQEVTGAAGAPRQDLAPSLVKAMRVGIMRKMRDSGEARDMVTRYLKKLGK